MLTTTTPALEGQMYRELRVVMGGCYPCAGGPTSSYVENAYLQALYQMELQAAHIGANAVIAIHTIMSDQFYVLLAGTAVWIDYPEYRVQQPADRWHGVRAPRIWGFLPHWTQHLWWWW